MEQTRGLSPGTGRYASLDGFRAISIGLVIVSHLSSPAVRAVTEHLWRWNLGATGVRTFFVISGFLITSLLLAEKSKFGRIGLRAFYARRALRIVPAYFVFLGVVAILIPTGLVLASYHDLIAPALWVSNYWVSDLGVRHTWSLSVEEQFYLLWPCGLVLLGRYRSSLCAVTLIVAAPILRILNQPPGWDNQAFAFETVADAIACGCLLAVLRDRLWDSRVYRKVLESRFFGLGLAVLLISIVDLPGAVAWNALSVSVLNFGIAISLDRYMRFTDGPFGRFLNVRPVAWIGTLSYSLYLWQEIFVVNSSHQLPFPLNVLGALLAASLSFYLIEKPFLALKSKIAPGVPAPVASPP